MTRCVPVTSLLRSLVLVAVLGAGLAACSSGATDLGAQDPSSQAAASGGEPEATAASSGFSDSDMSALRPETDESRETLWRLKGHTVQNQLRR